ncbi:MAG: asparagine synthase (glutamine-hydrolyzing), partial [Magnetococcales bacterium]|nr:asparagine synthase (glutamine-hydrolyzing) [Magnetococcales bacterium]
MCGLAGFAGNGTQTDLERITRSLNHRGPDGEGFYIDCEQQIFLGHRRLAILDLAGGEQPMWTADRRLCIVFNGEIYNHAELRTELQRLGHKFLSNHSDTETLLYGYREWGTQLPERLNGMFAFVIYDLDRKRLFAARDRFGKKPFYYSFQKNLFIFASELSALRLHPGFTGSVNPKILQKYFAYGFIPAPNALYHNSFKLPGGSYLELDLTTFTLQQHRYWRFRLSPDPAWEQRNVDDLAEELRALLSQAVKRRMESDVPLGFFLSGGIDSSAILSLAARHVPPESLHTFSIGFREPSYDESSFARQEAQRIGSQHHEEILTLTDAKTLIPSVLSRLDEPMGDYSILPTYLLSAFTRRHVTVALGGDGGDELFAGYDPFMAITPGQIYQRLIPNFIHKKFRTLADMLPISNRNMSLDFRIRRFLAGLSHSMAYWNPTWMAPLEPQEISDLFHQPIEPETLYSEVLDLWHDSSITHPIDKALEYFSNLYLQDDILTKVDRASMMVSLEVRAPFLDNDVVAFAQRLPHTFKLRRGERKFLLKKAMTGLLPDTIIHRPKKGFGVPIDSWLKSFPPTPPLLPAAGVDIDWVARRWQAHRLDKADHRLFLWSWLSLQYSKWPLAAHQVKSPSMLPIFVVGCDRSGTTLLTTLIESRLGLITPLETHFIPYFAKTLFLWGNLEQRCNRERLLTAIYHFLEILLVQN